MIPKAGDIGLTQISGWGGKAIRAAQWLNGDGYADYEHVFVVSHVYEDGTIWIVEAMPGGAQTYNNWHDLARCRWLICPDEHREAVAAAARSYIGVPYSVLDYASLAARRIHLPVPRLRKYIKNTKHMICSQLADQAAADGGWHLFNDNRWAGDVTPGDLNKLWVQQHRRS